MAGPSLDAFGVVARLAGTVGHMEPQVEPAQGIGEDDNGLNGVVDAVVGGLVVEPGRVARGPLHVGDSGAEAGAKGQQGRGEEHEEDAGAHAAPRAKVVDGPVARQQHGEGDDGDGQEGEDGEEGDGEELDVAQLRADVGVEGVEAVDGGDDDHDEQGGDGGVEELEGQGGGLAPADTRLVGAQDALGEHQVDDEEEQHAGVGEDGGGDGDGHVVRVVGPDDAHDVGADAGHGEAEEEGREDELVPAAPVALEDGHVEGCRGDEEGDEDG